MTAKDIVERARITEVWSALGGPKIRHGRSQAFWRDGDGFNVGLDDKRGAYYDFSRGEGGGMLDLVVLVRGCSRAEALAWLADLVGISLNETSQEQSRDWKREREERRAAELWAWTAVALAELLLDDVGLSSYSDRAALTRVITLAQSAGLIEEYRAWLKEAPGLTKSMVQAGRVSNARIQKTLAAFVQARAVAVERGRPVTA